MLSPDLSHAATKKLVKIIEEKVDNMHIYNKDPKVLLIQAKDIAMEYNLPLCHLISNIFTGIFNTNTHITALKIAVIAELNSQEANTILTETIQSRGNLTLAIHIAVLLKSSGKSIEELINALRNNALWLFMIDTIMKEILEGTEKMGEIKKSLLCDFPLTPEIEKFYRYLIEQTKHIADKNPDRNNKKAAQKNPLTILILKSITKIKEILNKKTRNTTGFYFSKILSPFSPLLLFDKDA